MRSIICAVAAMAVLAASNEAANAQAAVVIKAAPTIAKGAKAVYSAGKGIASYVAKSRAAKDAARQAANKGVPIASTTGGAMAVMKQAETTCKNAPGTQIKAVGLKCAEKR